MRLKTFLSALLVASLLAMSSVGSACDLACSLPKVHSCCAATTTTVTPAGMSVSQENQAGDFTANTTSHPGMAFLLDEPRSAELCSPSAVSFAVFGVSPSDLKSVDAPAVSLPGSPPHLVRYFYPGTDTALARISAIRSALFNLRI